MSDIIGMDNDFQNAYPIEENTDLDDCTIAGLYKCPNTTTAGTLTNCPVTYGFPMIVMQLNDNNRQQIIYGGNEFWMRGKQSSGWTTWRQYCMSTVADGTLNTSALPSTVTVANETRTFIRKSGKVVWLSLELTNTATTTTTVSGFIPTGYRPKALTYLVFHDSPGTGTKPITAYVNSSGDLNLYFTAAGNVRGTVMYLIP